MIYLIALLVGFIAGLRAMIALAAVTWAASLALLDLSQTWLAFLGYRWTPRILTLAALGELVSDKLPKTPSRKVPPQFGARLFAGGLSGAAIALASGSWIGGLVAGLAGAVIGTIGGAKIRATLASAFGKDFPAAIFEDLIAIVLAIVAIALLP